MKSEKASQILLLTAGLVFFLVGIFRGEAAIVLSKAIKLCMSVSELDKKMKSTKTLWSASADGFRQLLHC